MTNVRLLRGVYSDLAAAVEWYNSEAGAEIANRFLDTFDNALLQVERYPESFKLVSREFRRVLLRPFPYALFFRMDREEIIVVLLRHPARSPEGLEKASRTRI